MPASIGYLVARSFQGQGIATEGLEAVMGYLRDELGVREVKAWTDSRNLASHRLARKLGMECVEVIKDADFFKGATSDEFVFSKVLARKGVKGQCYCGAVAFELTFPTLSCSHCHCEDCRRSHGAAFVTWTDVPKERFRWLRGSESLRKFESHPGVRWGFWESCGTSLTFDSDDAPDKIYVTVASLLGPLDRAPEAHFNFEERVAWLHVKDGVPKYVGKSQELAVES